MPVKAGIVDEVQDYEFSNWGEFAGTMEPVFHICDTATVLRRVSFEQLNALMYEMLPEDVRCIDMEDPLRSRPSDDQVWQMIIELSGVTNSMLFRNLKINQRKLC